MPRDPFLPESTTAMENIKDRTRSPDGAGGSDRKRRRKVLSCYDCRRRKVQCDRAMPACGRCVKAGQASNCLYIDDPVDAAGADVASITPTRGPLEGHMSRPIQAPAPENVLSRLEYQDKRVKQLEAALARAGQSQPPDPVQRLKTSKFPLTPESVAGAQPNDFGATVTDKETMLLRGKSFKTHFHGTTHPGGLIAHIPDLSAFTKETFENFPTLSRIRHDMRTLENRVEPAGSRPQIVSGDDLKALLLAREEVDQHVQLYMENYGGIYNILHLPTFWKEYNEMWADLSAARPHFVALVLLLSASVQCLTTAHPWLYTANSSMARERAITYIEAVDDWMDTQSQKHVTATDFQIRFLLLFSRQVSARKYKRTWTEAGTHIRYCMCAGLHRNPEYLRKPTSALDKELRRRVWTASAELELQASFDRGMVPEQWTYQADCSAPTNISDEDVNQESDQLPNAKQLEEWTMSSYLATASESLLLRHTLTTTLNNIRQILSFEDIKRYTEEVQTHLENLPEWRSRGSDVASALLSLTLRQYLLALHDRQVRQAQSSTERSFSRMVLIDTATHIIDTHKTLINRGCYALEVLCSDQLRAALSICHIAVTLDLQSDNTMNRLIEEHASQIMDDVIEMLTDKCIRFGREQRQLWIALASRGLWKSVRNPSQRISYMQEALDKISQPYYKIMACQEDPTLRDNGDTTTPSRQKDADPRTNMILDYLPPVEVDRSKEEPSSVLNDPPLMDLDEIAAWTFEDWNFNPAELQQVFAGSYQS